MLAWPDALCEALARGGRHVVRYDLRDAGASTTVDPEAPAYTLRELAADPMPARRPGRSSSSRASAVAALDHPGAFSATWATIPPTPA